MFFLEIPQTDLIIIGFIIVSLLLGWIVFEFRSFKEKVSQRMGINNDTSKLQLQAYERLALFAERNQLISMTTRLIDTTATASHFRASMIENMNAEYEHNLAQQIYVTPEIWKAVAKLKEQNSYVVNQLAASLPADASALDLAKAILEFSNTQNVELGKIVLDAISFESKKLLQTT